MVYSSPGADDAYLRPKPAQRFAPRQVAISTYDHCVWLSWIHYDKGEEYLVITKSGCNKETKLQKLSSGDNLLFSKPVFLRKSSSPPDLFCAVRERKLTSICRYAMDKGIWRCVEKIKTRCHSIYYMDVIENADGGVFLVYSGISNDIPALQMYSRTLREKRWSEEQPHQFKGGFVNRPRLAAGPSGIVAVVADVYRRGKYDLFWKALAGGSPASWQRLSMTDGWNLFPSLITDRQGGLWVSWLREFPVRREDVIGLYQEARVAHLVSGKWRTVPGRNSDAVTNLNLGLLPVKRYFGYSGLRRYPRLMATSDGAIWLLWEQQKDEKEIWENVQNGLFCAKELRNKRWSNTFILADEGVCHSYDEKKIYEPDRFIFALKGPHRHSGNDFRVLEIELPRARRYRSPFPSLWRKWKRQNLPIHTRSKKRSLALARPYHLFWGDLHCHSFFSPDAEGEPDELYFFARDLARLDFAAITDNDFYPYKALLNSEVHYTAALAECLSQKGKFLALLGFEWTFHRDDRNRSFNHRTVIFTGTDRTIIRRNESSGKTERAFKANFEKHNSLLMFPHHADWALMGSENEPVVEVTSAWGTYILDARTVHRALLAGRRIGFIGNGDSHRFIPGLSGALTGIYARELTKSAIIEALKSRRCFATTGNRTALAFRLNDSFMGEETISRGAPCISWAVEPETSLEKVEVIRNCKVIHRSNLAAGDWVDKGAKCGRYWYYLRVKEKGKHKRYPHNVAPAWGKWAWSSPIWVTVRR